MQGNYSHNRILFVCHGNICRSAMAQCVMQWLVDEAGLGEHFTIDSAATTNEEIGMPIYPPARGKLREKGVPIVPHRARRIQAGEDGGWNYIVCMDDENVRHLRRILGPENMGNVSKLLSYCNDKQGNGDERGAGGGQGVGRGRNASGARDSKDPLDAPDVADPWYTRDFDATYRDVLRGCRALLEYALH